MALKNSNGVTLYMDSFGAIPMPEAIELAKARNDKIIYNVYRIQDFDSNLCGLFTISFIENVKIFYSFNKWLLQFSPNDFKKNDRILFERLGFN